MMLMAAVVLAITGRHDGGVPRHWPIRLALAWRAASGVGRGATLLVVAGAAFALWSLLLPYAEAAREYHLGHPWSEIASMLPRPESYLLADYSKVWAWLGRLLPDLKMRWEHQLFFGAIPLYLMVAAIGLSAGKPWRRLLAANLWTLLGMVLLTLSVGGWSLYEPISALPGLSAIRAVSRFVLVMLMPLAVAAAACVDGILDDKARGRGAYVRVLALFVGAVVETFSIHQWTTNMAVWQTRIDALALELPDTLPDNPILDVARRPGEELGEADLDAMFLAQERGWKTTNGYSGSIPPGYRFSYECGEADQRLRRYFAFYQLPAAETYQAEKARLVTICPREPVAP
jgi:hypothetical protein